MTRIGFVGCDSGHTVTFAPLINHLGHDPSQWVSSCRVVAAWPGDSHPDDRDRIARHVPMLQDMGLEIVQEREELLGLVDAVMVMSMRGCTHLEDARPFLEAGMATYIDRHLADSYRSGLAIAELADRHGAPLFSASALRYAAEVGELLARCEQTGPVIGALAYSGASLHPRNPGLYNYAVHAVETLYALMGRGCRAVSCTSTEGADMATGLWEDGRLGAIRGIRSGQGGFGFQVWCENAIEARMVATDRIYTGLLQRVCAFLSTGKSPVPIGESLEVLAFMDAAAASAAGGSSPVALATASAR